MANATHLTKVFGVYYKAGDTIPDFGSLRVVNSNGNVFEIEGLSADLSKLPTTVAQGSQAFFLDTKQVYKFNESDSAWKLLN